MNMWELGKATDKVEGELRTVLDELISKGHEEARLRKQLTKALDCLDDLFEQTDEIPLEYRSQGFTDALRGAEDLLVLHDVRVK